MKHPLTIPLLVSALGLAACNIAGPGLWLLSDDRTPSVYQLDSKRTTVVFIDDRNSVLPVHALRDRIAKAAEAQILDHKLLDADLVSSDSLQSVVAAERFSRPQSIAQIGRSVGADQVIYATVDKFQLTPDGSQHAPSAILRVKVIDARNDVRLFPAKAEGGKDPSYELAIGEQVRASALPSSNADRLREQQELADSLGRRLGELFFKHSSRDPDSKIGR
ncbi:MAG TPA: hypothetical protein VHC70_08955 [Phycisphaerales bacterium]|jgi:hypothetical protein|nr:hypothetical protein [Phycisphaerales bacterium]